MIKTKEDKIQWILLIILIPLVLYSIWITPLALNTIQWPLENPAILVALFIILILVLLNIKNIKNVLEKKGYNITLEKTLWLIIIILVIVSSFLYFLSPISSESSKTIEFPIIKIPLTKTQCIDFNFTTLECINSSDIIFENVYLKFSCTSKNTKFITEDSNIICSISAKPTRYNLFTGSEWDMLIGSGYLYVEIEAVNIEIDEIVWGCYSNITIPKHLRGYTEFQICENPNLDNVLQPDKTWLVKFRINYMKRYIDEEKIDLGEGSYLLIPKIEFDIESNVFFKGSMIVASKREAYSMEIAERSYMIAAFALILFVPILLLDIRKLFREKK